MILELAAEGEIVSIRQRGQPAKNYIKEFKKVAGHLRVWPECLLVRQFYIGLDKELRQSCMYRGLPSRLSDWFKAVIELDVGLQEFRPRVKDRPVFSPKVVYRPSPMRAPVSQLNLS